MSSILLLNCILTAWLFVTIGAITVSIDRTDIKIPPTRSSMIANGWRPLTNSYEDTIGTNVSPSSLLEKNVQVHPVLSKFQEHMATSEKLKPLRKGKPPVHEYSPPSILGSFTVFGHAATKARGETKTPGKHVATETREYTFLIPPPKDAYRFEMNQHRKPVVRDSPGYLPRQPPQAAAYVASQNVHQQPLVDSVRAATYFIKGMPSNRPYVPPFAMPQALQPPRQPEKPFESLKVAKPYFQLPGEEIPGDFGKQKIADGDAYDTVRYQAQSHAQVLNSASSGNFYSQVNHPANHYKSTYERDPAFLVHESHEVSYATPSGSYNAYNFRPSLPYESLLPPAVYSASSSTPPSTTAVTRNFGQSSDAAREHYNKRPESNTRNKQEKGGHAELSNPRTTSAYYLSEHQELTPPTWPKSKYAADINEVLPKESPPSKFSQEVVNQNQITQGSKIAHHRPQSSFEPVEVYPPTQIPDYETPESISLKHFNEQQFLLQQQLLLRDRQRLTEQERQQKLEIERQQQEELKKQQQELNQLAQREKEEEEAARLAVESVKNQSQELVKISSDMPYTIQLAQFEPQVTTNGNILVSEPGIFNIEQLRLQPQISQIPDDRVNQNYQYQQYYQNGYQEQQVNYREPQTETRPYLPQKPSRDPQRRKKPTNIAHELSPTEPPSQPPETSIPFTLYAEEIPIQTTVAPEVQTASTASTQRSKTRRPVAPGRRRKPATTTQEPVTTSYPEEDFLKYNREDVQHNQHDASRRRRIKPTQASYNEDAVTEKRAGNVRKRPSHRTKVSYDESYNTQIVTEDGYASLNSYGQTTESAPSYKENNQFATNQPSVSFGTSPIINQYYDYSSRQNEGYREDQREDYRNDHRPDSAVPEQQVPEYFTEISRGKVEDYNADTRQQNVNVVTSIPLEDLYVKTDGNYYDRATTDVSTAATTTTTAPTTTTTTTTSTTPQPATQAPQIATSTSRSHKIRPLRYGNATRPRFSIKDYKSRMDYKSRLSQSSTTEVPPTPSSEALTRGPHIRQRTSSAKSQQAQLTGDAVRETTGRYKYVSRVNYRTTTVSPAAARNQERQEESVSSTTEKSKYMPKRRPISGNVYRSRIASTTSSPTRSQINSETNIRQSSVRPENVYSSSIRRRPIMKNRLQKESNAATYPDGKRQTEPTEMAAEETSFYSTASSTSRLVGNEIVSEKGEVAGLDDGHPVKLGVQESKNQGETVSRNEETRAVTTDAAAIEDDRGRIPGETETEQTSRIEKPEVPATAGSEDGEAEATRQGEPEVAETTMKFDVQSDEEELFAKASQSVADLTSSASALYDKPGMFKAVSPESRLVSPQFKITTDEPTLPIEAFFQELTKKN